MLRKTSVPLSLVFSFKNHKNPRSTKVFDTAIHPNGVLRGASDNGTGGFQLLEVQMVLSLVSKFSLSLFCNVATTVCSLGKLETESKLNPIV